MTMLKACLNLLLGSAMSADPQPNWPSSFFANFTHEDFPKAGTSNGTGYYALDLGYDNGKGAQAIFRSDGTSTICGKFHANTPCTQLAVGGQRYLVFPELGECCTCCSWKQGCGPILPQWTKNARYEGRQTIDGTVCDAFSIRGLQVDHLMQTTDGEKLCELDNGGVDHMFFDLGTFTNTVDPALFALPTGGCSKRCGMAGHCSIL